jgi:hypothetical protein
MTSRVVVVDMRPRGLRYEPRGRRLTHDGHRLLWDAFFFERAGSKSYRLFFFADNTKVWMREESWASLFGSGKRKPFAVPDDLVLAAEPPLERLLCPARSMYGGMTQEQERVMNALTGFPF